MNSPLPFLAPDRVHSVTCDYVQLATASGFRVTAFPEFVAAGLRRRTVGRYRLIRSSDGGATS